MKELNTNNSKKLIIGETAFEGNLDYSTFDNPIVIPARVKSIGDSAFGHSQYNYDLKFIKFMGSTSALNDLGTNWYKTNIVEYIKSKDEY